MVLEGHGCRWLVGEGREGRGERHGGIVRQDEMGSSMVVKRRCGDCGFT